MNTSSSNFKFVKTKCPVMCYYTEQGEMTALKALRLSSSQLPRDVVYIEGYAVAPKPEADYSGIVEIPATYRGMPVIEVKNDVFIDCPELKEVHLPDSLIDVGRIGLNCPKLKKVVTGPYTQNLVMTRNESYAKVIIKTAEMPSKHWAKQLSANGGVAVLPPVGSGAVKIRY